MELGLVDLEVGFFFLEVEEWVFVVVDLLFFLLWEGGVVCVVGLVVLVLVWV